jgi:hypothetical protein
MRCRLRGIEHGKSKKWNIGIMELWNDGNSGIKPFKK